MFRKRIQASLGLDLNVLCTPNQQPPSLDVRCPEERLKHFHHLSVLGVFVVKICFFALEIMNKLQSRASKIFLRDSIG